MRIYSNLTRAVVLGTLVMTIAFEIHATPPSVRRQYDYRFTAPMPVSSPGTYEVDFSFTPLRDLWTNAKFEFITKGELKIIGESTWTTAIDSGKWVSIPLQLNVAPNDTSHLYVKVYLDSVSVLGTGVFFISSDNTAEMKSSISTLATPQKPNNNIDPDTLTEQQLAEDYRFSITIETDDQRRFAEDMFGPLPDSIRYPGSSRIYILRMTMGDAVKLHKHGITVDFEPTHPTEAEMRRQMQHRKPPKILKELKLQSLSNRSESILLAHVDGMEQYGVLPTGRPITFYLWVNNILGDQVRAILNGFRVYSPDGATWGTTSADTLEFGWDYMFGDVFLIDQRSTDGSGADTCRFLGFSSDTYGGLPAGFQEIGFSITIGPIPAESDGKTICLDSSWFGAGSFWSWSDADGYLIYPEWDGPHCFTVSSAIQYSGFAAYRDIRPPVTTYEPTRGCVIEWWEDRPFSDQLIQAGYIEGDGDFPFFYAAFDHEPDLYFKLKSSNYVADVSATVGGTPFEIVTPVSQNHPGGNFNEVILATTTESPFFFVADHLLHTYDRWTLDFGEAAPTGLTVDLAPLGEPSYHSGYSIHIEGSQNDDRLWPDYWDVSVIDHEYGHAVQNYSSYFDASPGGYHEWDAWSEIEKASNEGFASFFAGVISGDTRLQNHTSDFLESAWFDLENGKTNASSTTYPINSGNNYGFNCEASVAGMLWDIFDGIDDDYSTYGVTSAPNDSLPDGVGDTLSAGFWPISNTLYKTLDDGARPDHIQEFWIAWFRSPSEGHAKAMSDIWYEHGVLRSCGVGMTGDLNGDGVDADPLDLSFLVENLMNGGPLPDCLPEGNLNGDSASCDPVDLSWLVDYLFSGGTTPVDCQ